MIIAIDGPAGTGKSTVAKLLAKQLGFCHFDTGAMYRAFAYGAYKRGLSGESYIENYLPFFNFIIKTVDGAARYYLDDEDVTQAIRSEAISRLASTISALPKVRAALVEKQRALGEGIDAVFEGRDIGTVVFPDADLKIFLTASLQERARRRYEEIKKSQGRADFSQILQDIQQRDTSDSTRSVSPLKPAKDAYVVVTDNLSLQQVVDKISGYL